MHSHPHTHTHTHTQAHTHAQQRHWPWGGGAPPLQSDQAASHCIRIVTSLKDSIRIIQSSGRRKKHCMCRYAYHMQKSSVLDKHKATRGLSQCCGYNPMRLLPFWLYPHVTELWVPPSIPIECLLCFPAQQVHLTGVSEIQNKEGTHQKYYDKFLSHNGHWHRTKQLLSS